MRAPLVDTVPNTGSTMRLRSVGVDNVSKSKSAILVSGAENQKKSSRVKVMLGGMFQRSSSRSLDTSAVVSSDAKPNQNEPEKQSLEPLPLPPPKSTEDKPAQDASQSTELESISPVVDESSVADVRLVEEEENSAPVESEEESPALKEERERVGATLLQALFRGYRQRYEYKMFLLRIQLEQIQANKQRQLKKIDERRKAQKKHDRSAYQFQHDKTSRQLQRVSRVVPYLFREAQEEVAANAELVASAQQLQELKELDNRLKSIACEYLDLLETIPGIWEALKVQWMEPKKPRIIRSFGPDGKTFKVPREYITHDDDLPVDNDEDADKKPSVRPIAPTEQSTFVNLFIQAHAHEIYATEESMDEAVQQVKEWVGENILN